MGYGDAPFFPIGHVFLTVVSGLLTLFGLLIAVAVIVLLVRFLLVATKAAQIYITKNTPDASSSDATPTPVVEPTAPAVVRPTRARTPKTPPKV